MRVLAMGMVMGAKVLSMVDRVLVMGARVCKV
jgi:hypothetical protein